ncbi:LysR family transcriptional regulator [Levilactobacillus enshiensis]|uniref:LysR family transcriptional regulator n=1 Tax=Levilactobacillus enshiensis TaxID=2590213 RepID=UPI00131BBF77|nr:LysR family transcriptional regulator [Levilactobacillus enshiensis]
MNITQLTYFVEVVASDFNISVAAEKIHVSQSTMSKSILTFEEEENVNLFVRHGKKLVSLTEPGRKFYRDAKRVIRDYDNMLTNVHHQTNWVGKVKVGIAPAVLVAYFSNILPQFRLAHPDIKIIVSDVGGEKLQQDLLLEKIDLAYPVAPIKYDSLDQKSLILDCGAVVFNPKLVNVPDSLTISELLKFKLVLLNQSFTIRDQLDLLLSYEKTTPDILMESSSESFLLNACRTSPLVTVLPRSILRGYQTDDLRVIPLNQLSWELLSTTLKKNEDPLIAKVRDYFDTAIAKMG